mgnify:CR=1
MANDQSFIFLADSGGNDRCIFNRFDLWTSGVIMIQCKRVIDILVGGGDILLFNRRGGAFKSFENKRKNERGWVKLSNRV